MHIQMIERKATLIAMYTFFSGIDNYDDDTVVSLYNKLSETKKYQMDDFLESMIGIHIDEDSVFVWEPFDGYSANAFFELVEGLREQIISQFAKD